MNEREKNEIGYKLFKRVLVEEFSLKDIKNLKEKVRNFSEETNISDDKLLAFSKIAIRETIEEEFIKMNKETKVESKNS